MNKIAGKNAEKLVEHYLKQEVRRGNLTNVARGKQQATKKGPTRPDFSQTKPDGQKNYVEVKSDNGTYRPNQLQHAIEQCQKGNPNTSARVSKGKITFEEMNKEFLDKITQSQAKAKTGSKSTGNKTNKIRTTNKSASNKAKNTPTNQPS